MLSLPSARVRVFLPIVRLVHDVWRSRRTAGGTSQFVQAGRTRPIVPERPRFRGSIFRMQLPTSMFTIM